VIVYDNSIEWPIIGVDEGDNVHCYLCSGEIALGCIVVNSYPGSCYCRRCITKLAENTNAERLWFKLKQKIDRFPCPTNSICHVKHMTERV
jgi:hypothetical protein